MTNVRVKPISELEVKSEVSASDKILILDSVSEEARLASKDELKGDKGDPGTPGAAATITVGTTSTGAAGTSASVTNSGTSSAAVFDFTIPKGDQGNPGQDGADGNGITSVTSSKVGKTTTVTMNFDEGDPFSFEVQDGQDGGGGSGSGDVVGPASATDGHLALFDGATGKLIKDGGSVPTGVPSGGTDGQVLSKVSGNIAWATPSGGDVIGPASSTDGHIAVFDGATGKIIKDGGAIPTGDVGVSTDTGTLLSAGVNLWLGTESDYSSISTPDTNTLYIQYKSDGGGGWQPGVNTLAYYKLEGDANDYSGNGYDGTWNGTSNYATLTGGKVVAQFDYNSSTVNYIYSSLSTAPKTVSFWMKLDSLDESNYQNRKQIIGQVNSESGTWQLRGYISPGNECFVLNGNNISYAWTTNWIYVTLLLDGTTISLYVNGTKLDDLTNTSTASSGTLYIGGNILGGNNSMKRALSGKMSEVILESELWTEQNITDYFNQTKANYGIS